MSAPEIKFKISYLNKKKKIDAPKSYQDFKSKCEELFSIKYKTKVKHALFYDEEDAEFVVKNKVDYKNFLDTTNEDFKYKVVLVPITPKSDDDDDVDDVDVDDSEDSKSISKESDSEKSESVKNDSNSEDESDSEEKKAKKPKKPISKPKAKPKTKGTPRPPEEEQPSFEKKSSIKEEIINTSKEPVFTLSSLEKKLAEIDEKLAKITQITELENRLNKTEDILNQIKSNQEKLNETIINKQEEISQKIVALDSNKIEQIKDSVIGLSKKEDENYSTLADVIKELKTQLSDICSNSLLQKQSKELSEHHSNNNPSIINNNNYMSEPKIEPQYIFDIANKTIQTTLSQIGQVPLMISYNGNVPLPQGFYIANSNQNLPITFDPIFLNNEEWIPPKMQTIIIPFKVIQFSPMIQMPISFLTPNGSPVQMITITLTIINDSVPSIMSSVQNQQQQPAVNSMKMYTNVPSQSQAPRPQQVDQSSHPRQPSQQMSQVPPQMVPNDAPYEISEEEMNKKIEELDQQFNVNSIFADNDIRDAIRKAKGDINRAQEILFD